MPIVGALGADDGSKVSFVDRRMGGVDHVTPAPQPCPPWWAIFVLQTIHVPRDRLLPLVVFLHKNNPIEVVLLFGGKYLCVIDAVKLLHPAVRDRNRLFAVF
jgi:hypothetical protein